VGVWSPNVAVVTTRLRLFTVGSWVRVHIESSAFRLCNFPSTCFSCISSFLEYTIAPPLTAGFADQPFLCRCTQQMLVESPLHSESRQVDLAYGRWHHLCSPRNIPTTPTWPPFSQPKPWRGQPPLGNDRFLPPLSPLVATKVRGEKIHIEPIQSLLKLSWGLNWNWRIGVITYAKIQMLAALNTIDIRPRQHFEIRVSCSFLNERNLWKTMHRQTKCCKIRRSTDGNDP